MSVSKYMNEKTKEYRIKKRLKAGKVRVEDVPLEIVEKMKALNDIGLSFGKIATLYGLSRYIVARAIEGSTQINK